MIQSFNDVFRAVEQLRTRSAGIEAEIERLETEHRRREDEYRNQLRNLRANLHEVVQAADDVRTTVQFAQREAQAFSPQGSLPLVPGAQGLAWEIANLLQRYVQPGGAPVPFGPPNAGQPRA